MKETLPFPTDRLPLRETEWVDWYTANAHRNVLALTKLRDDAFGGCGTLGQELYGYGYFDMTDEQSAHLDSLWKEYLTKMIDGFKAALILGGEVKDDFWTPTESETEALRKKFSEGMELYTKYYFDLWD